MQNKANLQELFLLRARRVVLDSDGKQQVIYKHAISTVAPLRPVDLSEA